MQTSAPGATAPTGQHITLDQATQAFTNWNVALRADPGGFYTPEECAAMDVGDVSAQQGAHFMACLRQVQGQ